MQSKWMTADGYSASWYKINKMLFKKLYSLMIFMFYLVTHITPIIAQYGRQRAYEVPVVDFRRQPIYQPVLEANTYGGLLQPPRIDIDRYQYRQNRRRPQQQRPRQLSRKRHIPQINPAYNPYGIFNEIPSGGFIPLDTNQYSPVKESFGYGPRHVAVPAFRR